MKTPFAAAKKLILLFLLLSASFHSFAQIDKEFWFAAPAVYDNGQNFDKPIVVRLTAFASPATVTISMPANPSFAPIVRNISASSTVSIDLTNWIDQIENSPADKILNKGILITSTADITAYYEVVSSYCKCNPEVFALKGRNGLGNEFFVSSQFDFTIDTVRFPAADGPTTSFDIVATQNNTKVTITPSKNIIGHKANIPFTITLNAGQTYSATGVYRNAGAHLQGSNIKADKPVAVTLKDDLVIGSPGTCADLIGDQTVPVNVLGNEYIVTKGYFNPEDKVYIMAVEDGTSVYIDGSTTAFKKLARGQSASLSLAGRSTYIVADKNIYVYHITGNGCEIGSAIIPKINCTGSQSVSVVRSSDDMFVLFLTIKNGYQKDFIINNNTSIIKPFDFYKVPGTNGEYVSARIDVSGFVTTGSPVNISNSSGKFSLGFINGGAEDGCSYGFFSDFNASHAETSQQQICEGGSAQLFATGGIKYYWSPATGLSNRNIANPVASPPTSTTYKVIITTDNGCIDSAIVNLEVLPKSTKKIDTAICKGSSYILPTGKIVSATGIYNDTLKYTSGCDSIITILKLTVTQPLAINLDTSFCEGGIYTLPTGKKINTTGKYTDTLKNLRGCDSIITNVNLTVLNATKKNIDAFVCEGYSYTLPSGKTVAATGTYIDTVRGVYGCDSVITTVALQALKTTKTYIDTSICEKSTYILPSGETATVSGLYTDVLKYTSGCDSLVTTVNLTVYALPTVNAGNYTIIQAGSSTILNGTVTGGIKSILWSPATSLDNNTILTPVASPAITTLYTLKVQTTNDCTGTDTVTVKVLPLDIVIPNVFSPNGDGINDVWNITHLQEYAGCKVNIFNRYGQQVFHSDGYRQPWKGTYNGKLLPVAVYYYIIDLGDGSKLRAGYVTILR